MNDKTVVMYETNVNTLIFKHGEGVWPFGISEIQGASSVSVALSEATALGQAGSHITGRQVQPRVLTINGFLLGEVEQARKQLLASIAPGEQAKLTIITESGESFYIMGEPTETPEITAGVGIQEFQFQLKCAYPYWKTEETIHHSFIVGKKYFMFPHYTGGKWYITKYESKPQINARNEGNVRVGVTIYLKALQYSQGPTQVWNLNTGEYIQIDDPMNPGDIFEICTEPNSRYAKSIESGIEKNGYYRVAFGSNLRFGLVPGDNILSIAQNAPRNGLELIVTAPKGVLAGV